MFRNLCFSSLCHTSILNYPNKLASSLEYPERIQRGLEWTQLLKRLSVCSLFSVLCLQIFSFFPLSSFSFYTVQYRRVQYSTVIGQLPRVSTEDKVVSVFEPSVCLSVLCKQIFSISFIGPLISFHFIHFKF